MEDEIIKNIDKNKILEFQQNRDPFLMIDYAEEIVIGESVKGYKDFDKNEWFLKFIGRPTQMCQEFYKLSVCFKQRL